MKRFKEILPFSHCIKGLILFFAFNTTSLWAITPSCSIPLAMGNNQWNMISLPCNPGAENTVSNIFGDELPIESYETSWAVFKYVLEDGTSSYSPVALDEVLELGKGYWAIQVTGSPIDIYLPDSSTPTDSDLTAGSGPCLSSSAQGCFITSQQQGSPWQINGNPFQYDVAWNTLRVTDGLPCRVWFLGNGCDIEDAEETYKPQGWRYNPVTSNYETLSGATPIHPWDGYWGYLIGGGLFDGFDQWSWTIITPKP